MTDKPQISIAFPQQLEIPDNVSAAIEQVITYLLGGGLPVLTAPKPPTGPTVPPITLPPPGESGTVVADAIDAVTMDPRVRLAMRLGALLEGGNLTGPWNAGDGGLSFGPFQIYLIAHPDVTAAQASDPRFAVQYMLRSYENAADSIGDSLWQSDPKQAAALTAFHAERPLNMYPQARIDWAWGQIA